MKLCSGCDEEIVATTWVQRHGATSFWLHDVTQRQVMRSNAFCIIMLRNGFAFSVM
jgi:hypothetical protein